MNENIEIDGNGSVTIGEKNNFEGKVRIIFSGPGSVTIGDYCTFGRDVKFVVSGGDVFINDWTTLHDGCLILCSVGVKIGEHCWFGQNCVLDGTGGLTIGNGVRVGMYSQIWSHVAAGERLEGCTLFSERPVVIEDNVWLVGSCIVSSGVIIGARTVALINSNVTKSWPSNAVLAGSPASLKEQLSFYREVSPAEKWTMLQEWLVHIADELRLSQFKVGDSIALQWADNRSEDVVIFVQDEADFFATKVAYPDATVCCIATKKYTKQLNNLEGAVFKKLSGNKARFLSSSRAD